MIIRNRIAYFCIVLTTMQTGRLSIAHMLIKDRYDGAIGSIVLSVAAQGVLIYIFFNAMSRSEGKTVFDLVKETVPKWVGNSIMLMISLLFFLSGAIQIAFSTQSVVIYITKNAVEWHLALLLAVFIGWIAFYSSISLLYALDVLLLLNFPIYIFLLFKMTFELTHSVDSMLEMVTQCLHPPNFLTVAASAFNLSGFLFLMVFNNLLPKNHKVRFLWVLCFLQLISQLIVFMLPISFFGTELSGMFRNPIMTVADSIDLPNFFIERLIFIMYLVHSSTSFINSVICWHVVVLALDRVFRSKPDGGGKKGKPERQGLWAKVKPYVFQSSVLLFFLVGTVGIQYVFESDRLYIRFVNAWYCALFVAGIGLTAFVFWASRRKAPCPSS